MKVRIFCVWAGLLAVLLGAGPRQALWQKVEEAKQKDQPKTQIELLQEIEKSALADEAWAEAARAMARRFATEGEIEGEALVLKKLDASVESSPKSVQPLLRALSAGWMHRYYDSNQWRISRRSSLGEPVGEDLETWDLARILKEIDARMQAALADEEILKAMPVGEMAELLTEPGLGDEWRPTVFDFVAHQALEFYAREEVAVSRPVDAFSLKADSPVFGTVEEFLAWEPEGDDEESPKFRALKIYQNLLAFHRNDEDPSAFFLVDLERLRWANQAANDEGRDEQFEAALRRVIEQRAAHPISAWALLDLGGLLKGQGKNKEAHAVFQQGAEAFPDHSFGKLCRNQVLQLEQSQLSLSTETHWTPAGEDILVRHVNLPRVWFRLYSVGFKPGKSTLTSDPLPGAKSWLPDMLKGKPVKAWDHPLVDEGDYEVRKVSFAVPDDLPDGYHVLVASADEEFSMEDNAIAVVGVHLTPLALTVGHHPEGGVEGHVLDAVTGAPLAGIEVGGWVESNNEVTNSQTRTDESGRFRIEPRRSGRILVVARRGWQRAVVRTWLGNHRPNEEKDQRGVVIFTDRSIYRPGQTVQFKGILHETNQSKGTYRVVKNEAVTVFLRDPNRRQIEVLKTVTNERGSFSGSFTLPEGGMPGRRLLLVKGVGVGGLFRVEEYKRPKFFTVVEPPEKEVVLGEAVNLKVRAEAYTGAAVDGGKVAWRVARIPRLPDWTRWCWWIEPVSAQTEEIAQGVTETRVDGSVVIEFVARPDDSVSKELEPVFDFVITADVTGGAGETRSASRRISVGYTGLRASLSSDDWLEAGKELEFQVRTESLDGEGRKAKGVLRIHRLKEPAVCPRPFGGSRGLFGSETDPDPDPDPARWEPGEVVQEFEVETAEDGTATVKASLDSGAYRLIFETGDARGTKVKALRGIQVVDPKAKDFPTMTPFYTGLVEELIQPGASASIFWGSGHDEARARVEWYCNGRLLKREWSEPGRTQQVFSFSVEESHRGGITVKVDQVTMNRFHRDTNLVQVPWTNKQLKIRWERLVSKLEPGAKETWTAVIESGVGEGAVAEMVATMYDASLDAFAPHGFQSLSGLLRSEWGMNDRVEFSSEFQRLTDRARFERADYFRPGVMFRNYRDELALFRGGMRGGRLLPRGGAEQGVVARYFLP